MIPKNIRAAVTEARAFIKAADEVLKTARKNDWGEHINPGKASGSLRRRSLDLSRTLSEMRRA